MTAFATFRGGPADGRTLRLPGAPARVRLRPGPRCAVVAIPEGAAVAGLPPAAYALVCVRAGRPAMALYRFCDPQPAADVLCDPERWSVWCEQQVKSRVAGEGRG